MAQGGDLWEVIIRACLPDPVRAYGKATGPWDGGGVLGPFRSATPSVGDEGPLERCLGGPLQRKRLAGGRRQDVRVALSTTAATISREFDVSLTHRDVICDGAELARMNSRTASLPVSLRIGSAELLPIKGSQPGAGRIANFRRLPTRRAVIRGIGTEGIVVG